MNTTIHSSTSSPTPTLLDDTLSNISPYENEDSFIPNTINTTFPQSQESLQPYITQTPTEKFAFAIIHFGNIPKYFELELYFCIMLKMHTTHDILYLYSSADTPPCFVEKIMPHVSRCIPFDDTGITYKVNFESKYNSFNTLRTCDFIFAYQLEEYTKICIVESDLVIMNNSINNIFQLNTPSILCYKVGNSHINTNIKYSISKKDVLNTCEKTSGINGGVILITPSIDTFNKYVNAIRIISRKMCAYPNEALFEYVNSGGKYYNLPVIYNLSHYHTLKLAKYGLSWENIVIFHFNETAYKHLDIIKENWINEVLLYDKNLMEKYKIRKIPILYFEKKVFKKNKNRVEKVMKRICGIQTNKTTRNYNSSSQKNTKKNHSSTTSIPLSI